MLKLQKRIYENNKLDVNNLSKHYIQFVLDKTVYGYLTPDFANELRNYSDVFYYFENSDVISFSRTVEDLTVEERTKIVSEITKDLKDNNIIKGWRDELLPVTQSFSDEPEFLLERAAVPYFGMKAYGVHVNGFVRNEKTKNIEALWVATRSPGKSTWPSMLDHIAAGGQPAGITLSENVVKECAEEAGIPREIAIKALPVGAVSYLSYDEEFNLKNDVLFCFDLELPKDFIPVPVDGEVESFQLKSLDWVINKIAEGGPMGYKPNCNLVVIDFLIRNGIISPDSPNYLQLVSLLRSGDCS